MKKLLIASVIAAMGSTAMAADLSGMSIGAGYGFGNGGVLSVHGDYDISQMVNKQPIKVRLGYDRYSEEFGGFGYNYKWAYNVFYGGAYYDFGKALQLGNKIHPFAGLGFGFGNATATCSGAGFNCSSVSSPTVGGFYYIFGAQYDLTPNVAAEANFNGWGGLSLGVNYKF